MPVSRNIGCEGGRREPSSGCCFYPASARKQKPLGRGRNGDEPEVTPALLASTAWVVAESGNPITAASGSTITRDRSDRWVSVIRRRDVLSDRRRQ
jgi:hypothetical protein